MSLFAPVPESLLHFAWQQLQFDLTNLQGTWGESLAILSPGKLNRDQGPDFLDAEIEIDGMRWCGHVELHLRSSDWYRHGHESDPGYNPVVLHVVQSTEKEPIIREDGTIIPELELGPRLPATLLTRFSALRLSQEQIPCAGLLDQIDAQERSRWVRFLAKERLREKASRIAQRLSATRKDWNQVLWEEVCAMMGGPVNGPSFRRLAGMLPFSILARHQNTLQKLEAMLLGVGGFLVGSYEDEYLNQLENTWRFLSGKYGLSTLKPGELRFMRMRPAGFPTLRLALLAAMLHAQKNWMDWLAPESFSAFVKMNFQASSWWDTHYRPGKSHRAKPKRLGRQQKELLITNVLVPVSDLYHRAHGRELSGLLLLSGWGRLPAEANRYTRALAAYGFENASAMDSQGLIRLKKSYCDQRRCLQCAIGQKLLGVQVSLSSMDNPR